MELKSKILKKIVYISLVASIIVYSTTVCEAVQKDKNVVVLENQQKEINDVLAIKKIDEIDNFMGVYWFNNGNILGIKNCAESFGNTDNKEISNICIYDTNKETFKILSNNTDDNTKVLLRIIDITKDERYLFYKKIIPRTDELDGPEYSAYSDEKVNIYIIDLKTGIEKKIADNVTAVASTFTDENKIFVAKGVNVYMYDVDGKETEIKLPKEVVEKLKCVEKPNFQEHIKGIPYKGDDSSNVPDDIIQAIRIPYEHDREHNAIRRIYKKDHELHIMNHPIYFVYNLKTNDYRELTESEENEVYQAYEVKNAEKFYLMNQSNKNIVRLEKNKSGSQEIWELDTNGKHKKLIAKGKFRGDIAVSPDHTKVVYCMAGRKGEKNMFVYDLKTEKSMKCFQNNTFGIFWDRTSKQFFTMSRKKSEKYYYHQVTNIITLN